MILKDEEVDLRLNSSGNLLNQLKDRLIVRPMPNGGRTAGSTSIPPLVRELIGSFDSESQVSVAEAFNVSQPTVSGASRGLVGDRKEFDKKTETRIDEAHELALDCLMNSLKDMKPALDKSRLEGSLSPVKLSKIATDMSKIVSSIKGDKNAGITNNTQVIIMAPPQKKLSDYDFIEG